MDGAGPGPRTGEAVPLAQDVFDARAELTAQRDLLVGLNESASEAGLPTAAISDLPARTDVQAFPAEPPVSDRATEALTEGTKDAAQTVRDATMPDVANMYDVATDYDNATDTQKQQAAIDLAGMAPIPGSKWAAEGLEHGLDALGVAGRHTDDIPTGGVDDLAGGTAHPAPDAPSVPHIDADDSPPIGQPESPSGDAVPDLGDLYRTEPNTGYFWSGRTSEGMGVGPQDGDLGIAARIADENGGVTLESYQARHGIELPDWGDGSDPAVVKAWENHSAAYASSVSGDVRAVLGDNLRPGNVWETVELPRLMENPHVSRIFRIDPETGVETLLFER